MNNSDYSGVFKWFILAVVIIVLATCFFSGIFRFEKAEAFGFGAATSQDPADRCVHTGPFNFCVHSPQWVGRANEPDQDEDQSRQQ